MKHIRLVVIFLFLALIMMACNLTSMLPGNDEENQPELEVTEETNLDTSLEEPMEEPEVLEEPTSEPVSDSMNNEESSNQSNSSQQSACDHPYFPMREGATWVYFEEGDVYYYHWEVVKVEGDLKNATANMTVHVSEFNEPTEEQKEQAILIDYNWVCSANEGIVSFDLAVLEIPDVGGQEFSMTMTFIDGEGVLLPPADQLNPGYTWEMSMRTEFEMEEFLNAEGTMDVTDYYTVISKDSVNFDGEVFDGVQFQREFNSIMDLSMNGVAMSLPNFDLDFKTITTMAKGIGYIKLDSDSDFGTTGLQLIRYNIP
jgi:hypothetical protein